MNITEMLNFQNLTGQNISLSQPYTIDIKEVITNVCSQLDEKLLIAALIIFVATTYHYSMYYWLTEIWKGHTKLWDWIYDRLKGLIYLSALYIIWLFYEKGELTGIPLFLSGLMVAIVVLSASFYIIKLMGEKWG